MAGGSNEIIVQNGFAYLWIEKGWKPLPSTSHDSTLMRWDRPAEVKPKSDKAAA